MRKAIIFLTKGRKWSSPRRNLIFSGCFSRTPAVFTRQNLLDQVWGEDYFGDERIVDTHIKNLRKKLGNQLIETVRGVGYRLEKIKK